MCLQLSVYSNPWIPLANKLTSDMPSCTGWDAAQETGINFGINQMTSTFILADKHNQREVSNLF